MRYISLDGTDGSGKSTSLELLKTFFESQGVKVHHTRGLGGDKSCDFQNALRTALLHNKFPSDNLILEETLFAIADLEGTKIAREFLEQNPEGVVLKDRGPASHYVYARARGMNHEETMQVHNKTFELEKEIANTFGTLNLIMVPTDIELALNRVKARQAAAGLPISERLENMDIQTKVAKGMREIVTSELGDAVNMVLVEIKPEDSIADVGEKIMGLVKAHL